MDRGRPSFSRRRHLEYYEYYQQLIMPSSRRALGAPRRASRREHVLVCIWKRLPQSSIAPGSVLRYRISMSENTSVEPNDDGLGEIEAMRVVASALRHLDPAARERVLRWTCEKYGGQQFRPVQGTRASSFPQQNQDSSPEDGSADLADLYAACQPKTDAEKTLVVSHWLQETQDVSGIDAQNVNTQLKHLGHGVGNITRAFDKLMENRPQLMIQTKKAGTTKQARKTYRVTTEGKNMVAQMRQHGSGT